MRRGLTAATIAAVLLGSAGCHPPRDARPAEPAAVHATTTAPTPTPPPTHLVRWHGPIEHIFFHPLVIQPRLAFTDDRLGLGFQHFFVTVHEFKGILRGLWRHGWTLVDARRAATGRVRVPVGRKPLVLSEDDLNYYAYFDGRGLAKKLVLDAHGDVRVKVAEPDGRTRVTDQDLIPLVDEFVVRHPEFSAQGARGLLGLTAYEGLFGEHNLANPAARARIRALVTRLEATGWSFASHTYGHIDLGDDSLATIAADTARWKAAARGLLPRTDMLIYPFGSRPTPAGMQLLRREGFPIQFDIDIRPRLVHEYGVTVMSRRHIDGYAFEVPDQVRQFFSVARVRDPRRPAEAG
jgi:hypothetical protein